MKPSALPLVVLESLVIACATAFAAAPTPLDEEAPWPRVRSTNGHTVTLFLPQVERWTSNSFTARAAVEVKPAKSKADLLGVVWFEARGSVDKDTRTVFLDVFEITKARFPEATDEGSNALAIVREVLPTGARTVSLDYLITTLGFEQAAARQGTAGLKHTPPEIIWVTNRTVLILIDGDPILHPLSGGNLERVLNTPELVVRDKRTSKFYLAGDEGWFAADSIGGPWSYLQVPPAEIQALAPTLTNAAPSLPDEPRPRILVRTRPAELVLTSGLPDYRPIRGTSLQYAADSDSQLFYHTKEAAAYLLISGRWFTAKSLAGPWSYISPRDLPPDFAKIPPGSPQAIVLASVPDTPQSELAVIANSVPTTATIKRKEAKLNLTYDGEPKFKPIDSTKLSYAVNARLPVIRAGDSYYALEDAVWFVASSPQGPWEVVAEVPEEIYTIPPGSPVYYTTFARVYQADEEEVEVGYTPGYQGNYEDDGTVVYGTGYDYEPWNENEYYGWGWTYGYSYVYVPWYQWWMWRPWWNPPGGLRAAVIENIYDRWAARGYVSHYDGSVNTGVIASKINAFYAGHPVQYGRYWPTWPSWPTQPSWPSAATQNLPPNALALNPYSRPQTASRPGEVPKGAQLLSNVKQAPGGGRDLYASPDGGIYMRKTDGWYRRQSGGGWQFHAPAQGSIQRNQLASAQGAGRGGQPAGAGAVYRPLAGAHATGARAQNLASRVPNTGFEAQARDVAALERQYYARSLAQTRAQNFRASGAQVQRGNRAATPSRPSVRRR